MPVSTLKHILFVLISLLSFSVTAQTDGPEANTEGWFAVTRVVDGDTFWVTDSGGNSIKIRLIGIDAPEPRNTGTRPKQGIMEGKSFR